MLSASGETSGALISAEPPLIDIMVELAFFFLSAVDEADAGAEVRAAGVGLCCCLLSSCWDFSSLKRVIAEVLKIAASVAGI